MLYKKSILWTRLPVALLLGWLAASACTAPFKIAIPAAFRAEASVMKVKGLNGWPINERVHFGNFKSSRIRRGWNTTSTSRRGSWAQVNVEDLLYRNFGVSPEQFSTSKKDKFRFDIECDSLAATIYAQERMVSNSSGFRTNSILGSFSRTNDYLYHFGATILPDGVQEKAVWQLQLTNVYDRSKDTARRFFDQPYVEETGYAFNGTDTIVIKPLYIAKAEGKDGKQVRMPFRILTGYELKWDGGLVCIVDAFGKNVWLHNNLEPAEKLLLSAMATAILLRRIQDLKG